MSADRHLVTGATGLVGWHVMQALRRRGLAVRCLVRDRGRGARTLPEDVELAVGDVTVPASLRAAVDGCASVFHAAGLPEQWLRDPRRFERINVDGTRFTVEAALGAGVEVFVHTSTIDVFAAPPGAEYDESTLDPLPKATAYERSKQAADRLVSAAAAERGLRAVLIHPSGVYGPGPAGSPGLGQLFADLRRGKVPMLLPGGLPLVYAPDVGEGHVLAAEALRSGSIEPGRRYILSESYLSLHAVAEQVVRELGLRRTPPVLPLWFGRLVSSVGEAVARRTGRPPLIPSGQLHFLQWRARPSAARARDELGWTATPFAEGLRATLAG